MSEHPSKREWPCRPGRVTAGVFALGLALATALAGFGVTLSGQSLLWTLAGFLLALWIGFKGAPLLLRMLSRAGLFGHVRIDRDRVTFGRASRVVDLTEPFTIEGRLQQSTIEREYDLRHVNWFSAWRPARKRIRHYELRITVLTLAVEQAGRRFGLVGDETSHHPGPESDLEALTLRRVAIGPLRGSRMRLWPADVAEVLSWMQESPNCEAVTTPIPEEKLEDPRRAIWPMRWMGLGTAAVLIAAALAGVGLFQHFQGVLRQNRDAVRAAALIQKKEVEGQAQALIGQRVSVDGRHGARFEGTVKSVKLHEDVDYAPEYSVEWRAYLTIEVETLIDGDGKALPADAELPHWFLEEPVRRGTLLEVGPEDVQVVAD